MARPLPSGKQFVDLAAQAARPSKIRREPPPVAKKTLVPDREENERWAVVVGIVAFTIAILAVVALFGSYTGWTPAEHKVQVKIH